MKFDWDRQRYEGGLPDKGAGWKDIAKEHPLEIVLVFLLGMGILVWAGVA